MAVEGAGLTVTCELVPPRGADAASVRAGARQWGEIADAVNVTDGPRASVRMSAVTAAAIMRAEGVETIVQMTTRDRNRIALTADALGSAALGVRGFLALHGDPVSVGENPEAAEVRDLQTLELIALLAGIREGRLLDGRAAEGPAPRYLVGAAAAAGADARAIDGLVAKLDAGADLVQTQIVLDPDAFIDWFGRCREAGVHRRATVLAGIAVPRSAEALAAFERMGARASEDVAERVERGESAEAVVDVIDRLAPVEGLAGVHIMPLGAPPELVRDLAAHARRSWAARAA
jgi:methylenetetrahydrofolate reductase (NADPH)